MMAKLIAVVGVREAFGQGRCSRATARRHIAATGIYQGLQIGIAPMAAGLAPHQHADIADAQRGSRGRQLVVIGAHLLKP